MNFELNNTARHWQWLGDSEYRGVMRCRPPGRRTVTHVRDCETDSLCVWHFEMTHFGTSVELLCVCVF